MENPIKMDDLGVPPFSETARLRKERLGNLERIHLEGKKNVV